MYESPFDVIVVGGGINGVGVARDCCLRGMHTLLIEAEDFASGATGASTGLIHGGPRYLEHSIHTTKMSCVDSGFIQKLAPQLLFRVPAGRRRSGPGERMRFSSWKSSSSG